MNCLDVRRILSSEPKQHSTELSAHLQNCPACQTFARQIEKFEAELEQTINIDVPDGLAERIILSHHLQQNKQSHKQHFRLYAIAASFLLTLGLVSGLFYVNAPYSLEHVAIKHVEDEIDHLFENKNVQLTQLNQILKPFNSRFSNSIGKVSYASICDFRNSLGVHLVVQVNSEPVTILLMPGEYVNHRKVIHHTRFQGVIIPIKNGSAAIIGKHINNVVKVEKQLNKSLKFTRKGSKSI